MLDNMKRILILEKIPAIVCAFACMASVLMGFVLGYVFFGVGEPVLAYGDTPVIYQAYAPSFTSDYPPDSESPYSPANVYDMPIIEAQEASHLYVVTVLGGYIAIYYAEDYGGRLKEVTSTTVGTLSPEELERLAAGIKIYSDEALALILQDYSS